MSNHLFAFKRSDYVEVIGGTYRKSPSIYATVTKDMLHRNTFVRVQFDMCSKRGIISVVGVV